MFGLKTKFRGKGSFRFAGTTTDFPGECSIKTSTVRHREIALSILDWEGDSVEYMDIAFNRPASHAEFSGTLDDGTPFRARSMGLLKYRPPLFIPGELEVGIQQPAEQIRFFVSNLVVARNWETRWEDGRPTTRYRPCIVEIPTPARLHMAELTIRKDAAAIAPGEGSQSQIRLTCALDVTCPGGLVDWQEIEEPIYRLCNLFSLASGRTVNWVAARGTPKSGADWWVYRRHPISPRRERHRLLDMDRYPNHFEALLRCLPRILAFTEKEMNGFRRALHLHHHSPGVYEFPVPFYVYGGAFEALAEAFCGKKSGYIGDRLTYGKIRASFRQWAEETMIPAAGGLGDEIRQNLDTKFDGLNNRFLVQRIEALAERFAEEYDTEVVKAFVKQRNRDTHGAVQGDDLHALHKLVEPMEGLLGRLLLRAVGYQGEYWDNKRGWWTVNEMK